MEICKVLLDKEARIECKRIAALPQCQEKRAMQSLLTKQDREMKDIYLKEYYGLRSWFC